jgi:hypothetical protein
MSTFIHVVDILKIIKPPNRRGTDWGTYFYILFTDLDGIKDEFETKK